MVPMEKRQELYRRGTNAPAQSLFLIGLVLAAVGMGLFAVGALGDDPGRAWRMFHINFLFFTGVSTGAAIFAATQKITRGKWAGSIIRFAEAGVAFMPLSLICFLVVFAGRHYLFPWIDEPTPARGSWLTVSWVFWRDLVSMIVVFGVAIAFVYYDIKPDAAALKDHVTGWRRKLYERIAGDFGGTPEELEQNDRRLYRLAPLLVVLYAYLFSLLGFDLIMSLAPYWISNLFGAFFFIGAFLTGMTMLGLMMVYWRGQLGLHDLIGRQQFHDLGKLVFGFSVFWAYLMYSQLMIIWYGNLREETSFVFFRLSGEWLPFALAVGLMVFLIPFWGLIWVKSKTTTVTFTLFLTISFAGIWLERYLLVQPSLIQAPLPFGITEIGVTAGFLGLFLFAYGLFARAMPMISPRLTEQALARHH